MFEVTSHVHSGGQHASVFAKKTENYGKRVADAIEGQDTEDLLLFSTNKWVLIYAEAQRVVKDNPSLERLYIYSGGTDTCSLCAGFNHSPNPCLGCPITEFKGTSGCQGTPYQELGEAQANPAKILEALRREALFLKGLYFAYVPPNPLKKSSSIISEKFAKEFSDMKN